jgi:hypothetical protein
MEDGAAIVKDDDNWFNDQQRFNKLFSCVTAYEITHPNMMEFMKKGPEFFKHIRHGNVSINNQSYLSNNMGRQLNVDEVSIVDFSVVDIDEFAPEERIILSKIPCLGSHETSISLCICLDPDDPENIRFFIVITNRDDFYLNNIVYDSLINVSPYELFTDPYLSNLHDKIHNTNIINNGLIAKLIVKFLGAEFVSTSQTIDECEFRSHIVNDIPIPFIANMYNDFAQYVHNNNETVFYYDSKYHIGKYSGKNNLKIPYQRGIVFSNGLLHGYTLISQKSNNIVDIGSNPKHYAFQMKVPNSTKTKDDPLYDKRSKSVYTSNGYDDVLIHPRKNYGDANKTFFEIREKAFINDIGIGSDVDIINIIPTASYISSDDVSSISIHGLLKYHQNSKYIRLKKDHPFILNNLMKQLSEFNRRNRFTQKDISQHYNLKDIVHNETREYLDMDLTILSKIVQ